MKYYNKPHEVRDEKKLQSMIATLENGNNLPPIIIIGDTALTGSHRLAAWEICEMEAEIIELSNEDYIAAMHEMGMSEYDEIYEYNEFCEALYKVTDNGIIKDAIKDQRGD